MKSSEEVQDFFNLFFDDTTYVIVADREFIIDIYRRYKKEGNVKRIYLYEKTKDLLDVNIRK